MKVLLVLVLVGACVDTGPGPSPRVDAKYARAHLLAEVPADLIRFDVALGDKAIYLGNKIDRTRLAPGQTLVIKHYWKVLKPLGKGWRPFGLVRGPQGTADFMNLDATDMQVAHPVAAWKANDIIEDEQRITIRPDWTSSEATVYVGLIGVGRHTTLDRFNVTGPRTHDRAIVAAKLEIDLSRAPPPAGTIHIPRATGPIVIDGIANDQGWATALTSPELVTADGSPDPSGKATARLVWDDTALYVFMSMVDTDVTSPYKNHDDALWKADAVELFFDADGNRAGYIELQVNPHNTTFDSWFAGPRGSPGDVPWDSGMVSAVKVRGTPDGGDTDQGWDVEISIPWSAMRGRNEQMAVTLPPRIGDRWRLNLVRVDVKTGNDKQSASSWNRISYGDWHGLDRMLVGVFADPTGLIVPATENPQPVPGVGTAAAPSTGSGSAVPGTGSGSAAPSTGSGSAVPGTGSGSAAPSTGSGSAAPNPTQPADETRRQPKRSPNTPAETLPGEAASKTPAAAPLSPTPPKPAAGSSSTP